MLIRINNKDVKIRGKACDLNGVAGFTYEPNDKSVNLYVALTSECNTNCRFCVFHGKGPDFDFVKFKRSVDAIVQECFLGKVAFTGGEPTLDMELLKRCVDYVKVVSPYTEVKINTNGTRLLELESVTGLDNVSLSRHSLSDIENRGIFRSELVPDLTILEKYKNTENLHLSCNMIKGYVDSQEKIFEYLEGVSKYSLKAVGFVSLMPVNEYAKSKSLDFVDVVTDFSDRFVISREYQYRPVDECVCKCRNYLYRADNNRMIPVFNRFVLNRDCDTAALFYDINVLKEGFKGSVIY